MLKQQKDACDLMIEEKNKLISDFEHVSGETCQVHSSMQFVK